MQECFRLQVPVVRKEHSAIHRMNLCPLDSAIGFPNTYPQDSDLSGGQRYPRIEQPGPDVQILILSQKIGFQV